MTGELSQQQLKQIESIISGKVIGIQNSISGSKDLITLQIKADLGSEYQKIIENANSGIANQLSRLFWIMGGFIVVIGGFVSWYINKIKIKIESKENDIKNIETSITNKQNEIKDFIDKQEANIYEAVIQNMADRHFNRVFEQPQDINNLFSLLATYDNKNVNTKHYQCLLLGINKINETISHQTKKDEDLIDKKDLFYLLIYQYFPNKLYETNIIKDNIDINHIVNCAFEEEYRYSTEEIIKTFKKNKKNSNFIKQYLTVIFEKFKDNSGYLSEIDIILGDDLETFQSKNYIAKTGERIEIITTAKK